MGLTAPVLSSPVRPSFALRGIASSAAAGIKEDIFPSSFIIIELMATPCWPGKLDELLLVVVEEQ